MPRPSSRPLAAALLTGLAAILPRPGSAQEIDRRPIEIGSERRLDSKVLGETRRLLIGLPEDHAKDESRYPVVYLLDGEGHFAHTAALLRFEAKFGRMPPAILVGIANTDRTRDLTPPTASETDTFPTAGGVDELLRFLRDEVVPLVEKDYRASPHRTLIGHSFGGLTVLHCLVHHPDDFADFLAISPSLWWDEQRLLAQAAGAFPEAERREQRLFMTLGNEDSDMLSGYRRMEALLSERAPSGLRWSALRMPDESHQTVPYRSTLLGLSFLYEPWALQGLGARLAAGGWQALDGELGALESRYGRSRPRDFRLVIQITEEILADRRYDDLSGLYLSAPDGMSVPAVAWEVFAMRALANGERSVAVHAYTEAVKADPRSDSLREDLRDLGGDPDAIPRPPALDPARAAALAGTYREEVEGSKLFLEVEFTDGELFATLPGGTRAILDQATGDHFRLFDGFIEVGFRFPDDAEHPSSLVFASEGEEPRVLTRQRDD